MAPTVRTLAATAVSVLIFACSFSVGYAVPPQTEKETGKPDPSTNVEPSSSVSSKATAINDTCGAEITCDAIPNAHCSDAGRCICKEEYGPLNATFCGHLINNRCDDNICHVINSTCHETEKVCKCRPISNSVFASSQNRTYCYTPPRVFGDLCDKDVECKFLGPNGLCKEGRCLCEEKFAYENNTCKLKVGILEQKCVAEREVCSLEKDGFNQHVECRNGTCQCTKGYKPSTDKLSCTLEKISTEASSLQVPSGQKAKKAAKAIFDTCDADVKCDRIPNAKCGDDGRCICKEDYGQMNATFCGHLINNRCDDNICHAINSTCHETEKVCKCKRIPNSVFAYSQNRTYCYTPPRVAGDLCDQDFECNFLGAKGSCKEGYCSCQGEFAPVNNTCKLKVDQLGLQCDVNINACFLEKDGFNQYVECRDGTCQCIQGYKPSKDKQSCNSGAINFVSAASLLLLFVTKVIS